MAHAIYLVDAFAEDKFRGNPAGVCILDSPASEDWMQAVAAELNQAETAFVNPENDSWNLRWFTPRTEVDLCGHATLASAHALWEAGAETAATPIVFNTKSGRLVCELREGQIEMDFPAEPPVEADPPFDLAPMLGANPVWFGKTPRMWFAMLSNEERVRHIKPDPPTVSGMGLLGLVVTARSETPGVDFVSRVFAPRVGINEDAVTGSAHCALAPFWSPILKRNEMTGYQASGRGGRVGVRLAGDRVTLVGAATTVLSGRIRV
ncbi:MAG: PhzF family phenazine biosynthesis protein [Fimbriimonadaceae bacterium]|nr:PhzF family phenazine biosynthesis protein [Fimbriimonadaceae bacterium]QYK56178.1 MAG: PhzF family phenazine biosynthesis protein [Fimbriimonadaceae bacterium]